MQLGLVQFNETATEAKLIATPPTRLRSLALATVFVQAATLMLLAAGEFLWRSQIGGTPHTPAGPVVFDGEYALLVVQGLCGPLAIFALIDAERRGGEIAERGRRLVDDVEFKRAPASAVGAPGSSEGLTYSVGTRTFGDGEFLGSAVTVKVNMEDRHENQVHLVFRDCVYQVTDQGGPVRSAGAFAEAIAHFTGTRVCWAATANMPSSAWLLPACAAAGLSVVGAVLFDQTVAGGFLLFVVGLAFHAFIAWSRWYPAKVARARDERAALLIREVDSFRKGHDSR